MLDTFDDIAHEQLPKVVQDTTQFEAVPRGAFGVQQPRGGAWQTA